MFSGKFIDTSITALFILFIVWISSTNNIFGISEANSNHSNTKKKVILFLGNSLTAGYGLDPQQAFPALIQNKIDSLNWSFEVINAGVSGETSSGGLRRIRWLLKRKIDLIVLELGANDGLRGISLELTSQNLQGIIDLAYQKHPHIKFIIAGMEVPPNLGKTYTAQFRHIFPELAHRNKASLIPFLLKNVGGIAKLNLPDGIHPNKKGHAIIAYNVWEVLEPILKTLIESKK